MSTVVFGLGNVFCALNRGSEKGEKIIITIIRPELQVLLLKAAPAFALTAQSIGSEPGTPTTTEAAEHYEEVKPVGYRVFLQRVFKLFACGLVALLIFLASMPLQAHAASLTSNRSSSYSVLGRPTVSVTFINRVLLTYQSPAAGKGQALYVDGVRYGIDPVFALAFFEHESSFGTAGVARVTHSLGNIRCTPGYPTCYQGYRAYATWEDGFLDWYQLIRNVYVNTWGLTTVDQIIPVYAPASENDVHAYIAAVKHDVHTWRAGHVIVR